MLICIISALYWKVGCVVNNKKNKVVRLETDQEILECFEEK
jgi:hypothetical protein